jgi:hypothetical protein
MPVTSNSWPYLRIRLIQDVIVVHTMIQRAQASHNPITSQFCHLKRNTDRSCHAEKSNPSVEIGKRIMRTKQHTVTVSLCPVKVCTSAFVWRSYSLISWSVAPEARNLSLLETATAQTWEWIGVQLKIAYMAFVSLCFHLPVSLESANNFQRRKLP